jgi:hypothetical protein
VEQHEFLARLWPEGQPLAQEPAPDAEDLYAEIDSFAEECQDRLFYDEQEVYSWNDDYSGSYVPEVEAFDILDDFFRRADGCHQAGEHRLAAAAYEKLFDIVWGDVREWFGFEEITGWLDTDMGAVMGRYLISLGQTCTPQEYVRRAWERVNWHYREHLITKSTPEQLTALETYLVDQMGQLTEPAEYVPLLVHMLRDLYHRQRRGDDDLTLCRRLRRQYPALFVPLMDRAQADGNWAEAEALIREAMALAKTWPDHHWPHELAQPDLECRLSCAREHQGDLVSALAAAQLVFYAEPDFDHYKRICALAERIGGNQRTQVVEEILAFLREQAAKRSSTYYWYGNEWAGSEVGLLAYVLLAEDRHDAAYELAMNERHSAQLVGLMGQFYLTVGWGGTPAAGSEIERLLALETPYARFVRDLKPAPVEGAAHDQALARAAECYHRLVEVGIKARGRGGYASAASYAAALREIYARQGRQAEFDKWYAGLMDTYRGFRALKDEFRKRFGPG